MDKSSLRVQFKKQIESIGVENRRAQSYALSQKLSSFLGQQKGTWTLFSPLNDEPNLLNLLTDCDHLQWAFPRVESQTHMSFCKVHSKEEMVVSSWGIQEPSCESGETVPIQSIDGCVVPGIAYDKKGTRLGRGGGFFDRFLMNFKGLKLGVAFDEGLTEETLPRESHDQIMDIVISPKNWIEVNTNEVKNGI